MNALVAAYDSDSDSDSGGGAASATRPSTSEAASATLSLGAPSSSSSLDQSTSKPASKPKMSSLLSALPPPTKARQVGGGGGGGLSSLLPPPTTSAPVSSSSSSTSTSAPTVPKKRQIKIDSLSSLGSSASASSAGKDEPESKRPKLSAGGGGGGKLSLFSMLPAPSAKPSQTSAAKEGSGGLIKEEKGGRGSVAVSASQFQSEASIAEKAGSEDDEDGVSKPKAKATKGNNDFRAMLGLKPATTSASTSAKPKVKNVVPVIAADGKGSGLTRAGDEGPRGKDGTLRSMGVGEQRKGNRQADVEGEADEQAQRGVGMDFFSLAPSTSSSTFGNSAKASSLNQGASSLAPSTTRTTMSISSAPIVDEEAGAEEASEQDAEPEAYKGWQQDPDGTWVPITPEAHASYAAWAQSEIARRSTLGISDEEGEKGAGGGGFDPSELGNQRIEDLQNFDAGTLVEEHQALAQVRAKGDAKYLKTASELGSMAGEGKEGEKKKDKMTGFKARQKGQLTSLLAMAEEKRESLEAKWAAGKGRANEARGRYGF